MHPNKRNAPLFIVDSNTVNAKIARRGRPENPMKGEDYPMESKMVQKRTNSAKEDKWYRLTVQKVSLCYFSENVLTVQQKGW